jgi:hypothetical protein
MEIIKKEIIINDEKLKEMFPSIMNYQCDNIHPNLKRFISSVFYIMVDIGCIQPSTLQSINTNANKLLSIKKGGRHTKRHHKKIKRKHIKRNKYSRRRQKGGNTAIMLQIKLMMFLLVFMTIIEGINVYTLEQLAQMFIKVSTNRIVHYNQHLNICVFNCLVFLGVIGYNIFVLRLADAWHGMNNKDNRGIDYPEAPHNKNPDHLPISVFNHVRPTPNIVHKLLTGDRMLSKSTIEYNLGKYNGHVFNPQFDTQKEFEIQRNNHIDELQIEQLFVSATGKDINEIIYNTKHYFHNYKTKHNIDGILCTIVSILQFDGFSHNNHAVCALYTLDNQLAIFDLDALASSKKHIPIYCENAYIPPNIGFDGDNTLNIKYLSLVSYLSNVNTVSISIFFGLNQKNNIDDNMTTNEIYSEIKKYDPFATDKNLEYSRKNLRQSYDEEYANRYSFGLGNIPDLIDANYKSARYIPPSQKNTHITLPPQPYVNNVDLSTPSIDNL